MVNYNLGKIYKIKCNITGFIYIGSTCEKILSRRLAGHVRDYKRHLNGKTRKTVTSFKVLERGDYFIMLLENVKCETVDELRVRERFHIENIECVNKVIPSRTDKEYKQINKEKIIEYNKEYYQINKEKIKKQVAEYQECHQAILDKQKIKERRSNKINCECGSIFLKYDKTRHEKTKKHCQFLLKM